MSAPPMLRATTRDLGTPRRVRRRRARAAPCCVSDMPANLQTVRPERAEVSESVDTALATATPPGHRAHVSSPPLPRGARPCRWLELVFEHDRTRSVDPLVGRGVARAVRRECAAR